MGDASHFRYDGSASTTVVARRNRVTGAVSSTSYDDAMSGHRESLGETHGADAGRILAESTPASVPGGGHDPLGRLDVQTDTDGSGNKLAEYDYKVRADGKRTSLSEEFWFDANEDGVRDAGEVKTNSYDWSYDDIGRLTDEVLDHWDDQFDQSESFTYDLTGNRLALERDLGNDNTIDASIEYRYDANDRLFAELSDTADDTTTIYQYVLPAFLMSHFWPNCDGRDFWFS